MSWDIYIMKFPDSAKTPADIPDDFEPAPLGDRDDLIGQILEVLPGADFSKSEWGNFEWEGCSIEFNMGAEAICSSMMWHVRGGGDPAPIVGALLDRMGLRGIDCQSGEFFDLERARESFGSWQKYRDRVVGGRSAG